MHGTAQYVLVRRVLFVASVPNLELFLDELPMLVSVVFLMGLLSGVVTFGLIEGQGVDPEALRGPAAVLGVTGITVFWVAQITLAVLMIWWLTRPSDDRTNRFGSKPVS